MSGNAENDRAEQSRARKGAVKGSQCVGAWIGMRTSPGLDRTLAGAALFSTGPVTTESIDWISHHLTAARTSGPRADYR